MRVCYSPEICELSGVINHKTEDFISIIKTAFSIFFFHKCNNYGYITFFALDTIFAVLLLWLFHLANMPGDT